MEPGNMSAEHRRCICNMLISYFSTEGLLDQVATRLISLVPVPLSTPYPPFPLTLPSLARPFPFLPSR